jgi:monothiol glutaredoxin
MSSSTETLRQIEDLVKSENVVLFMKGSRSFPQCGFSAAVVQILNSLLPEYKTVNVLADPAIRQGVKDYSSWPTVPQLYVGGEFVGGSDIVKEMFATGQLQQKLGVEVAPVEPPAVEVTPPAAAALREALGEAGADEHVHVAVSADFEHELELGPRRPGDIEVAAGGITLLFDPISAGRARGLKLDFVEGPQGAGFRIENPNAPAAPPAVRGISPSELKARLDAGELGELYDVRPPDERARAHIAQSRLLDQDALAHIESLDRATPLAFYCHTGGRSRAAAQRFVALGFREVYNLTGGVDAWSREVDPTVPRYS